MIGTPHLTIAHEPELDHLCVVCGKYGANSPDFGKTWFCRMHDPRNNGAPLIPPAERPPGPSWDPCQACNGDGCPWCRPTEYGLPPRKGQPPSRPALHDLIDRFGGYNKISAAAWQQYDRGVAAWRASLLINPAFQQVKQASTAREGTTEGEVK